MRTEKLYYKNQFLTTCKAKLIEVNERGLVLIKQLLILKEEDKLEIVEY